MSDISELCDMLRKNDTNIFIMAILGNSFCNRTIPAITFSIKKSYVFLILSGLATGASWICYFRTLKLGNASQVAPIDKLSVVLAAIFGFIFLAEKLCFELDWYHSYRSWCFSDWR